MKKTGFFGKLIYGYDKLEEYLLCGSLYDADRVRTGHHA